MTRITIKDIRKHEWFAVDLAAYLFPKTDNLLLNSGGAPRKDVPQFDQSVVAEVCEMLKVSHSDCMAALKSKENPFDALKVAYDLITDNRRMEGQENNKKKEKTKKRKKKREVYYCILIL